MLQLFKDVFHESIVAGELGGLPVSSIYDGLDAVENSGVSESAPKRCALRSDRPIEVCIEVTGASADRIALAADANGSPGAWNKWGKGLRLPRVDATNTPFWIKSRGGASDPFGADVSASLMLSGENSPTVEVKIRRLTVPLVSVLGTTGRYHIGIDWGDGVQWRHDTDAGDFDVYDASGAFHRNVAYDGCVSKGNVTTFHAVELAKGLSVVTTLERKAVGTWRVTHTFESETDRWLRIDKRLRDGAGSVLATSDMTSFRTNSITDADANPPFQAVAAHHPNGCAVALIAGNGYDNDYCIYRWDYVAEKGWYNANIVEKGPDGIRLTYGLLKNLSTSDYTVHVPAGEPRSISCLICACVPATQAELNASIYNAYHDAFCKVAGRNPVEKMLWSTAHQLQRIKRHIRVEGRKELVIPPCDRGYGGMISLGDMIWQGMALNDPEIMRRILSTLHRLGPPDGKAAFGSVAGCSANNLDGTYAVYLPFLELYARKFLGYQPEVAARETYLATADAYADAINHAKMIPDASTRLAHYYSDLFGGPEGIGFGDFEEDFSFPQSRETRWRWTEEKAGTGSSSRVETDEGVAPHGGRFQCKLSSRSRDDYARCRLMRIAVPPSKQLSVTAYLNIPVSFAEGGFRFNIIEQSSSLATVANPTSPFVTITRGWQEQRFRWKLHADTCYILIAVEVVGVGTAFVDDVQCVMEDPPFPGIFWNLAIMPPQIRGDTLSPNTFSMTWTQVNLKCLKVLLGKAWREDHDKALRAVDETFPAAWWLNSDCDLIVDDLYHHRRRHWLSSWALFSHYMWYLLSGEKILTDRQVGKVYERHPKTSANGPYGEVAFKGWICAPDGGSIGGDEFSEMFLHYWPSRPGFYVNAGCWLWAADTFFYRSAGWAKVPGAEKNRMKRLALEVHSSWAAQESINSVTGEGIPIGYGSCSLMLIDTRSGRDPAKLS
jgi:hypothetical protein